MAHLIVRIEICQLGGITLPAQVRKGVGERVSREGRRLSIQYTALLYNIRYSCLRSTNHRPFTAASPQCDEVGALPVPTSHVHYRPIHDFLTSMTS